MEKAQVAVGGPFCGVRRRPKFLMRFYSFVRHLSNFWAFYAVLPVTASNWISVGDRITGLFKFFSMEACLLDLLIMVPHLH